MVGEHAQDLFERSLDLLCIAGLDGYLRRVNPSWTRALGWTAEELLGRPSLDFVHPDDRCAVLAARARLRDGVVVTNFVNRYLGKDGTYRLLEWKSSAHPEEGLVYGVARDITDRSAREFADLGVEPREDLAARFGHEQLQRRLILADRMASVGTLAAGAAHELNNPLTVVFSNLELLADGFAERPDHVPAEWLELVSEARQAAERLRRTVHSLKSFAGAGDPTREATDLGAVIQLAVELATGALQGRARLVVDDRGPPRVRAAKGQLTQVFLNLLVNSAQALPDGNPQAHEVRITTSTDAAGQAVVELTDTGPGIPESLLARIFEPFFTTKPINVGTGLGLWVCHDLVTGLGGEIEASNRPGGGASFRVILPAYAPPAPPPEAATPTD